MFIMPRFTPRILQSVLLIGLVAACAPDSSIRNSIGMDLVFIPAGTFKMGSDAGEADEKPRHTVEISKPFYIGKYEVTQGQWEAVMGTTLEQQQILRNRHVPLNGVGPDYPMYFVNWEDAVAFTQRLNTMEGTKRYRLPTEAEWEYACRAGTTGENAGALETMAWYAGNAEDTAHPVGQKQPNPWGLYDMHGNVWEWCLDWLDRAYYSKRVGIDPPGGPPGERRMIRGGCWFNDAETCRSAYRSYTSPGSGGPHLGFRVVMMVEE